jgi:hypothetical protein
MLSFKGRNSPHTYAHPLEDHIYFKWWVVLKPLNLSCIECSWQGLVCGFSYAAEDENMEGWEKVCDAYLNHAESQQGMDLRESFEGMQYILKQVHCFRA